MLVLDHNSVYKKRSVLAQANEELLNLFTVQKKLHCVRNFNFQFLAVGLTSKPIADAISECKTFSLAATLT